MAQSVDTYSPTAEKTLLDAINVLRQNPEKYREVQKALKGARSDKERVHQLLQFATTERDLASLMPARAAGADEVQAAITTVTVTTVFIIVESAY